MAETTFTGQTVRLGQFEIREDQLIEGITATDCLILGPAVVVLHGCTLDRCTWEHPGTDIGSILWRFPKAPEVVGCLVLANCNFVRCNFRGVGIAGTPEMLADWRQKLAPTPASKAKAAPKAHDHDHDHPHEH
jgi:hypothetical protein